MARTKTVDPMMTPWHSKMLGSTMYEHLLIPRLILLFKPDPLKPDWHLFWGINILCFPE